MSKEDQSNIKQLKIIQKLSKSQNKKCNTDGDVSTSIANIENIFTYFLNESETRVLSKGLTFSHTPLFNRIEV